MCGQAIREGLVGLGHIVKVGPLAIVQSTFSIRKIIANAWGSEAVLPVFMDSWLDRNFIPKYQGEKEKEKSLS